MRSKALLAATIFLLLFSCSADTKVLKIRKNKLNIEIADTDEERATGLMFRNSLDANSGMLFVFQEERSVSFWMKNTYIPLSIAYINSQGVIMDIYDMVPLSTKGVPSKSNRVAYALEVNQGYFKKHGIEAGDTINLKDLFK